MLAFQSRAGQDRQEIALRNEKIMQKWLNLLLGTEYEIIGSVNPLSYSQIKTSSKCIITYQYCDWSIRKWEPKISNPVKGIF